MSGFFVTGTDTDIGKTLVSAAITFAVSGTYWKPVQSGGSDLDKVKELSGLPQEHFVSPAYSLKAYLSPDQAAAEENIRIDLDQLQKPETSRTLIVEGAGGLLVPLNESESILDLIKKLGLPVIIVCRGTLGTINHTLLTIEVLRQHGMTIQGVVFSGELNRENQSTIEKRGKVKTLFHLPYFDVISKTALQAWVIENQKTIREALT